VTRRPHILFVDDEPNILGGLRRMLRGRRGDWEMSFAGGGAAALEVLRTQPCDVVVSDYRMPGMDGAELLTHVRDESPSTARVILSGQTNEENLLGIMLLAHEVLTKPSTPEKLIATIERLVGVGAGDDPAIAESLPSPPGTLIELMAALDDQDASAQSVSRIIERDPAATAKVLHLVNSSIYSAGRKIGNVGQAVALLGLDIVRGLVLVHDLIRTFDVGAALPPGWIDGFTEHSIETSRLARMLAAGAEWESYAFTAGLLHEVGQLMQAASRPAEFQRVLTAWQESADSEDDPENRMLCTFERAAFDTSHLESGVNLLGMWGLPTPVIEAVAGHVATEQPLTTGDPASAVRMACAIVESELGRVCGPVLEIDETKWDDRVAARVSQWRREPPDIRR
jgi:HD-like signal output (HDOD) protein/ActR/RegA family two-component response regulator